MRNKSLQKDPLDHLHRNPSSPTPKNPLSKPRYLCGYHIFHLISYSFILSQLPVFVTDTINHIHWTLVEHTTFKAFKWHYIQMKRLTWNCSQFINSALVLICIKVLGLFWLFFFPSPNTLAHNYPAEVTIQGDTVDCSSAAK